MPVLNIGRKQTVGLDSKLTDRRGNKLANPKDVRRVLKPSESPRANITFAEELANLHAYLGIEGVDKEHLEALRSYMLSVLRIHFDGRDGLEVDTLPARIEEADDGMVLSIAGDERVIAARSVAKTAYGAYYGVPLADIADEVWVGPDDSLLTRVNLAESAGPSTNNLLWHLYVEINSDAELLPASTSLGAPAVLPLYPTDL